MMFGSPPLSQSNFLARDSPFRYPERRTNFLMRNLICTLALLLATFSPGIGMAATEQISSPEEQSLLENLGIEEGDNHLPGIALAEGISQMTGVAISPLLGVSVIGGWTYFRTAEESRDQLPWVCHPAFWGIGLGILLVCFFKDSIGNLAPAFVKKPLDFLELFEDKFSALIAGTTFVPFLIQQYSLYQEGLPAVTGEAPEANLFASIPAPILAEVDPIWIITPLALFGFFVVWIVSHSLTVLIALSPFKFLDFFLKAGRVGFILLMTTLYFISPVLVAILSCILIVICAFLAPSAFRLSVYGTIVSFDFIRSLIWKKPLNPDRVWCFLAKRGNRSLKTRSLGRITPKEDGHLTLSSRWLFLGKNRILNLGAKENLILTHDLLFPTLQKTDPESGKQTTLIHLLPRFRHCSKELASHLGIEFREAAVVRGYRAAKEWIGNTLRPSQMLPESGSSES